MAGAGFCTAMALGGCGSPPRQAHLIEPTTRPAVLQIAQAMQPAAHPLFLEPLIETPVIPDLAAIEVGSPD